MERETPSCEKNRNIDGFLHGILKNPIDEQKKTIKQPTATTTS